MKSIFKRVSRLTIPRKDYSKEYEYMGLFCKTISPQLNPDFESSMEEILMEEIGDDESLFIENLTFERIPDKDLGMDSILLIGDIIKLSNRDLGKSLGIGTGTSISWGSNIPVYTNPIYNGPLISNNPLGIGGVSVDSSGSVQCSSSTIATNTKTDDISYLTEDKLRNP